MGNRLLGVQISIIWVVFAVKQSHYCGNQQKLRTLQESFTPVQSFAAETYFILIMITLENKHSTLDTWLVEAVY